MSRYIDLDQVEFLKVDGNEEFNHGVDCCVNRLLEAEPIKAVPLDRIKVAREEVANYSDFHREHLYKTNPNYYVEQGQYLAYEKCLQILNKLIAEVEGAK